MNAQGRMLVATAPSVRLRPVLLAIAAAWLLAVVTQVTGIAA